MQRCTNGHYYDPTKHSTCPACGVDIDLGANFTRPNPAPFSPPTPPVALGDVGGTRKMGANPAVNPPSPAPPPIPSPSTPPMGGLQQAGRTIALYQGSKAGVEPVVGWLVCVAGPDRGRDYRIRAERNFIGRAKSQHICIESDEAISREKHAILTFNPKKRTFKIQPGDSAGLVYVNDEDVDGPLELKPSDEIEIGRSKLRFVPLCGADFMWEELDEAQAGFTG
ncbi:MAG: FHA domain-containing protein [Bacteroidetes Order II. Incertae sedis bacterium]|nr:FHA domain-containing protein [Bacteroidetes Order II. bacterium]